MSKDKVDSITADVAAPKGQAADTRSSEVTVKVGVGPRSGRKASLGRQSAADCGPSAAAGVSSRAGGGSDASVRGVGGTANPALKTKRVRVGHWAHDSGAYREWDTGEEWEK